MPAKIKQNTSQHQLKKPKNDSLVQNSWQDTEDQAKAEKKFLELLQNRDKNNSEISAEPENANDNSAKEIQKHLNSYLLAVKNTGCSAATIRNYKSDIKQFLDFLGENNLEALGSKPKLLAFAKYQREKGLKDSSIKRKIVSIGQFKNWLKDEGLLKSEIPLSTKQVKNAPSQDLQAIDSRIALEQELKAQQLVAQQLLAQQTQTHGGEDSTKLAQETKKRRSWFGQSKRGVGQAQHRPNKLALILNIIALLFFIGGLGYLAYQQFGQAVLSLAYPSLPTSPNRILSFQGRLTNTARTPIATQTDMVYKLYDNVTGGNLLWSSNTCTITPDQDGIFNTNLGAGAGDGSDDEDCGATIDDSVFTENSNVWLEVTVGNAPSSETLTPRQPIRTVAYAINAETVQGIRPSLIATHSTLLMLNDQGQLVLGTDSPEVKTATGSSLMVEADSIMIQTQAGSDGDIILAPDGIGNVGIGTTDPSEKLDVNGNILVQANGSLDTKAAGSLTIGGTTQTGLTLGRSGATTSLTGSNVTLGGIGYGGTSNTLTFTSAGTTGQALLSGGTGAPSFGTVGLTYGGTNANLSGSAPGGVIYRGASSLASTGAGTTGQVLISQGSGAPIWSNVSGVIDDYAFIQGGNSFASTAILGTNDAYNLQFETGGTSQMTIDTTGKVGIGNTSPSTLLQLGAVGKAGTLGIAGSTSGLVTLQTAAAAGTWTMTLPTSAGTSGQVLTTNGSGVTTWANAGAATNVALSGITAALSANSINNGDNAQVWNWQLTTADKVGFTFGENVASTATGSPVILSASTLASSTAMPLYIKNLGAANSFRVDDEVSDTTPFVIDASGNVGIGTTAPYNKLHIMDSTVTGSDANVDDLLVIEKNGDSNVNIIGSETSTVGFLFSDSMRGVGQVKYNLNTNNMFFISSGGGYAFGEDYWSASPGTNNVVIQGNVGIGTTTPSYKFDVAGDINLTGALRANGSAGTSGQILLSQGTSNPVWSDVSGVIDDYAFIQGGNSFGTTGILGTNDAYNLQFETAGTTKMTIETGGNVGIGTGTPRNALEVAKRDSDYVTSLRIGGITSGASVLYGEETSRNQILFSGWRDSYQDTVGAKIAAINIADYVDPNAKFSQRTDLAFYTLKQASSADSSTEKMRITALGNVGIGTTNPTQKLEVNGNIQIPNSSGKLYWGSSQYMRNNSGSWYFTGLAGEELTLDLNAGSASILSFSQGNVVLNANAASANLQLQTQGGSKLTVLSTGNVGIGTTAPSTLLQLGTAGTTAGTLSLAGATSGLVTINTAAAAGTWSMTLPTSAGTSGQVLTTNGSGVTSWAAPGSASNVALSGITAALSANSINNGDNAQVWNWQLTTAGKSAFTFGENTASTATGNAAILSASTLASSTAMPLYVKNLGAANSFRVDDKVSDTTPFVIDASGNVGIGTASPLYKLDVNGDLRAEKFFDYTNTNYYLDPAATGTSMTVAGSVGIGTTSPSSFKLRVAGHVGPNSNDSYTLGSTSLRWADLYLGPDTLHIGSSTTDEGLISYNTTNNILNFSTDSTSNGDIAFFSDDLYLDKSLGNVGIGTTAPGYALDVNGTLRVTGVPYLTGVTQDSSSLPTLRYDTTSGRVYWQTSSIKYKTNVVPMSEEEYLKILDAVPVTFNYINSGNPSIGVIAEQLDSVGLNSLVYYVDDEPEAVLYDLITVYELGVLKYHENRIADLESKLSRLTILEASQSELTTEFNNFKNSLIASISSALISTQKLVADQIEVGGQTLNQYIKDVVQLAFNNNEINISEDNIESTSSATIDTDSDPQPTMLAELIIENDLGETMASIDNQGNAQLEGNLEVAGDLVASGSSRLGQLLAQEASVSSLLAENISTDGLEAQQAQIAQANIDNAQMQTASVSGELYAQNISTDNLHTTSIDADIINGLQERLEEAVAAQLADATLLASITDDTSTTEEYLEQVATEMGTDLYDSSSDKTLDNTDTTSLANIIMAYSAYIDSYFEVNGSALIKEALAVGQTLLVGNGLSMGDGYIAYQSETSNDLAIQPAGRGRLSLMANLMTLDESGLVTVNGDLKVAGAMEVEEDLKVKDTLLTNLISAENPNEGIHVQLAQAITNEEGNEEIKQSNFEFIDESGTPIATMSASGDLSLTGGLKVEQQPAGASESANLNNKSAGQAVIPAGATSVSIKTARLGENSMIYITPLGSTNNQVIYVQNKLLDSEFTEENEAQFTVGVDFALDQDVYFNWWLVN